MDKGKNIFYYLLFAAGILGLADTAGLLFYTNANAGTLLPGFAGLLLVIYTCLKLSVYKDRPVIKSRIFRYILYAGFTLFLLSFVIIESMIINGSNSNQNIKADYLVILGAGVNGETVSLTLKERLDRGFTYLKQYPEAKAVVSGGKGFEEEISEAEAMKRYLTARGIDPGRIIMEDRSSSTMENFMFTKRILSGITDNDTDKIVIVTSGFHMLRAKMLARRNGFEPFGIACSTPASVRLNCYVREYFALIKSYFIDRLPA